MLPPPLRALFAGHRHQKTCLRGARRLWLESLESRLVPTTFKVLNTNDSGTDSLREAITLANADAASGTDTIQFNIAPSGVQIITLDANSGPLPAITRPVLIDGSTEGGFGGTPLIVLNGSALTTGDGLTLASAGSTVKDLAIVNFTGGSGVVIGQFGITGVTTNTVVGCYLGVAADGKTAAGNDIGVRVDNGAFGNKIGGLTAADRNVISGNSEFGIDLGGGATTNDVQGNYIGLDATGMSALANGRIGIIISGGANANRIGSVQAGAGNVISANVDNEILLDGDNGGASANSVEGNFIGTDKTGAAAPANANNKPDAGAVVLMAGATNNLIGGGVSQGDGNVISANGSTGVIISDAGTTNNTVSNNVIGLDLSGSFALPNNGDGVAIRNGATANTIGGGGNLFPGNVISANAADGILIADAATTGNMILKNLIGTNASRKLLGNAGAGVHIQFSPGNSIGTTSPTDGNLIIFNGGAGVAVGDTDGFAPGNAILGNSIFSNSQMGISLAPGTAPSPPMLTTAQSLTIPVSGQPNVPRITITGTCTGTPSTTVRIEFFANLTTSSSGFGDGAEFLGATTANVGSNGTGSFTASFPIAVPKGKFISATATGQDNTTTQFAQDIVVTTPGVFLLSPLQATVPDAAGQVTFTVQRQFGSDGTSTVSFNEIPGTALTGVDYAASQGTLTFGPGQRQQTFSVTILNNPQSTTLRSFTVALSSPTGGSVIADPSMAAVQIQGTSGPGPGPGPGPSNNAQYVGALYIKLLDRNADQAGANFWTAQIDAGASRQFVALAIEYSLEGRAVKVQALYQTYLHRNPDPLGLQNATTFLTLGGTIEQLKASILASPEYFFTRGQGTNAGFLEAIYLDVLGRALDPASALLFGQALAQGAPRFIVALTIVESFEADLALTVFWYETYLGRSPDLGGANSFITALQAGARDELLISAMLGSDEFFQQTA